jgi:hypothetical protein
MESVTVSELLRNGGTRTVQLAIAVTVAHPDPTPPLLTHAGPGLQLTSPPVGQPWAAIDRDVIQPLFLQ